MNYRWWLAVSLLIFPPQLKAQDAHSLGISGAGTAAPMELFGFYSNPSLLALPGSGGTWTIGTGGSFFDTSNANSPILRFTQQNAGQSAQDPINRYQQYLGIFGVKYLNVAGGATYDQELTYHASQGSLAFLNARDAGPISPGTAYNLDFLQTTQQIANFILSYSTQVPIGTFPFLAVGGSLKYHDGIQFQQTNMSGAFTQGSGTGYQVTKTTSASGLGLSIDGGFIAKVTDSIQIGMMFQNFQSNFSWQAKQQVFALDPLTGQESLTSSFDKTVDANFPSATKLGILAAPQDKNLAVEAEITWTQGVADWRFGLERWYPENHLVVRFGTFNDRVSNSQLFTFGAGYQLPTFNFDLAFLTRSLPAVQDSISFGIALDGEIRF